MAVHLDLAGRLARRRFRPALYIKRFLPRTLLGRSLLIIVSPLILLQVITTYAFYQSHWELVIRRLSSGVAGDVAMAVDLFQQYPDEPDRRRLLWLMRANMDLKVSFAAGQLLPSKPPPKGNELLDVWLRNALIERVGRPFHIDWTIGTDPREIHVRIQLPEGVLLVIASRERLFNTRTYIFILWMVGSSLILFAVAMLFMRNQVRPLRRLAQASDSFGKGRDIPGFKPEGATEVRQAGAAFNLMRGRIRRQIQQRTEMLAGVSHDLRTPLTRMKLQLAMLGDGPEVNDLKSDVAEMERMIGGYLAFARGAGEEEAVDTELSRLLGEVVGNARRDGAVVDLHTEGRIMLPLRPEAFRRCLGNLIANATRYGRHVWVQAARRGESVQITIDDDGPGVPPTQRDDVFKPFYRIDQSRNPETGGVGLGLTIARDVVHRHGGEIALDDSPYGGLRVRLGLPV
jgi:two-component system osmolarity sensor histidine kinase EnvZ